MMNQDDKVDGSDCPTLDRILFFEKELRLHCDRNFRSQDLRPILAHHQLCTIILRPRLRRNLNSP